jgi:prolipoprotein diacylglyceryltransferase
MYPTLSHLIEEFTGVFIPLPIQTFGFMLAISFMLAAWTLSSELKRKEKDGLLKPFTKNVLAGRPATFAQYFTSALIGFLIGWKLIYIVFNYAQFVEDTQQVLLSSAGNIPAGILSALLAVYLRYRESEKNKRDRPARQQIIIHPYQLTGNLTLVAAVAGILGAKLFHNLENIEELIADPLDALISFSGLTMYGGLICGTGAVIWYARKYGIDWKHLVDATAPGLMLAYGTGRIGCHLSGDGDWGIVNLHPKPSWLSFLPDWAWTCYYPHNVINEGIPILGCQGRFCMILPEPVFPTPLYEAVICIALFFVLWPLRKKIRIPGMLFSVYLIMNGTERFLIEKIRVNPLYHFLGLEFTQAEIISVALFIAGIAGVLCFRLGSSRHG